ncbi:MAG: hypothetical protein HY900_02570 [Deltaproteobacteria bacterium]|nr:hypothetical protein [Deltaproteobacteria bacterium]
MNIELQRVLEQLGTRPGQGGMLEQIDKLLRRQQRIELFEMLERAEQAEVENLGVTLERATPQLVPKKPIVLRFLLPTWRGYDDVFWRALGDYTILALHRVKDVAFDVTRGKITIEYFPKTKGRIRSPEEIRRIVAGVAYLVETEALPTDFTYFRRMAEKQATIGAMSKEQAALVAAVLKAIPSKF